MPEIPARFWLNLETDYQLTKALIKRLQVGQ
jgi:plasmid maintenance system antidote protein VapI